jgi:hypothetical protein
MKINAICVSSGVLWMVGDNSADSPDGSVKRGMDLTLRCSTTPTLDGLTVRVDCVGAKAAVCSVTHPDLATDFSTDLTAIAALRQHRRKL